MRHNPKEAVVTRLMCSSKFWQNLPSLGTIYLTDLSKYIDSYQNVWAQNLVESILGRAMCLPNKEGLCGNIRIINVIPSDKWLYKWEPTVAWTVCITIFLLIQRKLSLSKLQESQTHRHKLLLLLLATLIASRILVEINQSNWNLWQPSWY